MCVRVCVWLWVQSPSPFLTLATAKGRWWWGTQTTAPRPPRPELWCGCSRPEASPRVAWKTDTCRQSNLEGTCTDRRMAGGEYYSWPGGRRRVRRSDRACTHTQDGARTFLRYWQVPWMQKSLYFFRHGFLFFPLPFPLDLPFPFLLFPSVLSASMVTNGSLGLLDIATESQKKHKEMISSS